MIKTTIYWVAKSPYLHLFLGLVVATAAAGEIWETVAEDLASGTLRGHHGVAFIGLWPVLRAISEIIEASDYLQEALGDPSD